MTGKMEGTGIFLSPRSISVIAIVNDRVVLYIFISYVNWLGTAVCTEPGSDGGFDLDLRLAMCEIAVILPPRAPSDNFSSGRRWRISLFKDRCGDR